jgi:CRP-like cAMP-binding protein
MPDNPVQTLAQIFPRLSPDALSELFRSARLAEYPAQITLCREGEIEHCFYVIVEGGVDVYKILEGQRILINQMSAGAHFGDLALLLDLPRTATIITAEPTRVLEIDRDIFAGLLRTNPDIVVALSQLVLKRFLTQEEKHLMEIARLKKRDVPPAKIFLSYARTDQVFATRLANNLLKQGIDVWLDVFRIEPAKSWARQIGQALDICQVMLLVLSPTSVASENVDDEWNYWLDQKKPLLAVLHQPCKVPYRLSKLQHVSFHETDYEQALARVVATLNTLG